MNHKRHSEHWEEQQVEIKESEIEVIRLENKEQEVWVGVLENEWAKDLSERIQDIEQREEDLERRERELGTLRKTVDRREEAVLKRERELQFREQEIVSQENRHRETRLREEIVRREFEAQRQMIERREAAVAEQEKGLQIREQEIISLEMYMKRKNQGTKQREERVQIQEEKLNAFNVELMDREMELMRQIDSKEELLERREKGVEQCLIWIAELDEKDDSSQKLTEPARHEEEKRMPREKHKDQQKEETVQRDEGIPVRKYEGLDEEEKKINFQRVQLREHEEKLDSQSRDIDRRFSMLQRKETAFAKELAFAKNCLRSARQLKTYGHHSSRFRLPRDSEEDEHTSDSEVMTQRAKAMRAQTRRLTAAVCVFHCPRAFIYLLFQSGSRSSGR